MPGRKIRFQFSLLALFGLMTLVALGCAALRSPTELWASGLFTLTLVVLLIALVRAVLRRGQPRPFSIGFALFGWAYLLVVFGPWFTQLVPPPLLSHYGLAYLQSKLEPERPTDLQGWEPFQPLQVGPGNAVISSDGRLLFADQPSTRRHALMWMQLRGSFNDVSQINHFQQIGHSLLVQLVGLVGGILACWFYPGPEDSPAAEPSQKSGSAT